MKNHFYNSQIESLDTEFPELYRKNSHAVLSDLRNLFDVKKCTGIVYGYFRISTKGNFELVDYNAGLYDVSIKAVGEGYYEGDEHKSRWAVRFMVSNLDDMMWIGYSKNYDSKEECIKHVDFVASILDDLVTMPTEQELNEMLRPFGIFGTFEG